MPNWCFFQFFYVFVSFFVVVFFCFCYGVCLTHTHTTSRAAGTLPPAHPKQGRRNIRKQNPTLNQPKLTAWTNLIVATILFLCRSMRPVKRRGRSPLSCGFSTWDLYNSHPDALPSRSHPNASRWHRGDWGAPQVTGRHANHRGPPAPTDIHKQRTSSCGDPHLTFPFRCVPLRRIPMRDAGLGRSSVRGKMRKHSFSLFNILDFHSRLSAGLFNKNVV